MQQVTIATDRATDGLFDALGNLDERDLPKRPPWWRIGTKVRVIEAAAARALTDLSGLSLSSPEPRLA
jgi:hypothetical protein